MLRKSNDILVVKKNKMFQSALRCERDIIKNWSGDIDNPVVSIRCQAFNHEQYIEQAIIGFLLQETRFPFEILIHDDASTDGTADIIRAYEKRYPNIIKPIYQVENQYSKGNRPGFLNAQRAKGLYVAVCEGDDYWLDPTKLEKQVDFLNDNPDYVISGHDAFVINSDDVVTEASKLPRSHKRDFSPQELKEGKARILTMSWVYRNIIKDLAPEQRMVKNGDTFFIARLGEYGKSHYHSDISPAAYRVHSGGIWSLLNEESKKAESANTSFWLYKYFLRNNDLISAKKHLNAFAIKSLPLVGTSYLFREWVVRVLYLRKIKRLLGM